MDGWMNSIGFYYKTLEVIQIVVDFQNIICLYWAAFLQSTSIQS